MLDKILVWNSVQNEQCLSKCRNTRCDKRPRLETILMVKHHNLATASRIQTQRIPCAVRAKNVERSETC